MRAPRIETVGTKTCPPYPDLVNRGADWAYPTFHRDVKRGIYPADWAEDPGNPGNPPDLPVGE